MFRRLLELYHQMVLCKGLKAILPKAGECQGSASSGKDLQVF